MALEHVGRDLYLKRTACDGKSVIEEHRVWDADRFLTSQRKQAEKLNADQKEGEPQHAAIQQVTREQYLAERRRS